MLLQFGALVLLLLPAQQQLLVQELRAGQQDGGFLGRLLLALALIFEASNHLVHLPFPQGSQLGGGLVQNRFAEP